SSPPASHPPSLPPAAPAACRPAPVPRTRTGRRISPPPAARRRAAGSRRQPWQPPNRRPSSGPPRQNSANPPPPAIPPPAATPPPHPVRLVEAPPRRHPIKPLLQQGDDAPAADKSIPARHQNRRHLNHPCIKSLQSYTSSEHRSLQL